MKDIDINDRNWSRNNKLTNYICKICYIRIDHRYEVNGSNIRVKAIKYNEKGNCYLLIDFSNNLHEAIKSKSSRRVSVNFSLYKRHLNKNHIIECSQ